MGHVRDGVSVRVAAGRGSPRLARRVPEELSRLVVHGHEPLLVRGRRQLPVAACRAPRFAAPYTRGYAQARTVADHLEVCCAVLRRRATPDCAHAASRKRGRLLHHRLPHGHRVYVWRV